MTFKMSKEDHINMSSKGGINSRSSETQIAWDDREYILKARKNGATIRELAQDYRIAETQIYRIIRGGKNATK